MLIEQHMEYVAFQENFDIAGNFENIKYLQKHETEKHIYTLANKTLKNE